MEQLNINRILSRESQVDTMKQLLQQFDIHKHNPLVKKGIYIYGEPGTGKTTFVMNILKEMNYDIIRYDAGDIRNKSIIDTITKHNMSDKNVMSLFHKKVKKIAIVMDEIDGMNNGDKGGINTLIKLIRPKKTKKQKLEEITLTPIICIGNYHIDKKIRELMMVCNTIDLTIPTQEQMNVLVDSMIPTADTDIKKDIVTFVQNDLRKLKSVYQIYNHPDYHKDMLKIVFQQKLYNNDTKNITQQLINSSFSIEQHSTIMNETDRTIVGLLWHENIIDVLGRMKKTSSIPFYLKVLDNICFADYIDRITFQKQIWQFNEMSSLIKTFHNNKIYNTTFKKKAKYNPTEVRFTKVLTKYSTEYNNVLFIQNLCQQLGLDRKDLIAFFLNNKTNEAELTEMFENYEISKLDINRMYRYIEKYTNTETGEDADPLVETSLSDDEN